MLFFQITKFEVTIVPLCLESSLSFCIIWSEKAPGKLSKTPLICLIKISDHPVVRLCSIWGRAPTSIYVTFSVCPSVPLSYSSVHLSVHHAPCLRNCTSSDHKFWYTRVKWWYLQAFFSFFFFLILIFWDVRGGEGGKRAKNSSK